LNEPFQVEETYDTTPFDTLGKVTYSKEEIQGRDLSANSCSGFQSLAKEVSQRPCKEKKEGLSQRNMLLDNEWENKGRPPFNFKAGKDLFSNTFFFLLKSANDVLFSWMCKFA
jgi:hypothetical protein